MMEFTLRKGGVIFREGEDQRTMYKILSGTVGIYANYGEPEQTLLTELSEGAFFGEMALLEDCPRSASAVVLSERAVLCQISDSELSGFFAENPEQVEAVMRHLSSRLRALTEDYREACGTVAEMNRSQAGQWGAELAAKVKRFAKVFFASRKAVLPPDRRDDTAGEAGGVLQVFQKGQVLFREGDESGCMYDLAAGRVGIYRDYNKPSEKMLEAAEPGSFIGEMGLIDHAPRSATAAALEDNTKVYVIREADFRSMMAENPERTRQLLRKLSARLRRLTRDYLDLCRLIAALDEAEENHTAVSQRDMALVRRAEEIWRMTLMDNSANYMLLGMGV